MFLKTSSNICFTISGVEHPAEAARTFILNVQRCLLILSDLTQVSVQPLLQLSSVCSSRVTERLVLRWCRRSKAATAHRLRPQPRTGAGDGVARRGIASYPKAWSGQGRRGGEEEPAHGVQVGIPHTGLSLFTGRMKQRLQLNF